MCKATDATTGPGGLVECEILIAHFTSPVDLPMASTNHSQPLPSPPLLSPCNIYRWGACNIAMTHRSLQTALWYLNVTVHCSQVVLRNVDVKCSPSQLLLHGLSIHSAAIALHYSPSLSHLAQYVGLARTAHSHRE